VLAFTGAHSVLVDTISFGPDREPRRWLPGPRGPDGRWRFPRLSGRTRLAIIAAVAVVAVAGVLVGTSGHARRSVNVPLPRVATQLSVLFGVPAHRVHTNLVIGGDYLWRLENSRPAQFLAGVLANGLSPLLPKAATGQVSQIEPAAGGVVAVISNASAQGPSGGTRSPVVFIPDQGPARVIARASAVAVAPGGARVWVQTAVRRPGDFPPRGRPKTVWSPTYEISLTGRRVSPVLRLPLSLVAATNAGLLTNDLKTDVLWNTVTGRPQRQRIPGDAQVVAYGDGVVIWYSQSCSARCPLHLTGLRAGEAVTIQVPAGWWPMSYQQQPVAFDRSGTRFVLPLERVDSSGNPTAEALYLFDATTKTVRAVPGGPSASDQPFGLGSPGIQLSGAWDQQGLLWVLATSGYGYFQLGYWTGTGPLHVYRPIDGNPTAIAAPGDEWPGKVAVLPVVPDQPVDQRNQLY